MIVAHVSMSMVVLDCMVVTGRSFPGILLFSQRQHQHVGKLVSMPWRIKFICLGGSSLYFLLLSGGGWGTWGGLSGGRSSRGMSLD